MKDYGSMAWKILYRERLMADFDQKSEETKSNAVSNICLKSLQHRGLPDFLNFTFFFFSMVLINDLFRESIL